MTIENHMLVDLNRAIDNSFWAEETTPLKPSEINEMFDEWAAKQRETESEYFSMFIECWHESELLSFAKRNTTYNEFTKWLNEHLSKAFFASVGVYASSEYIDKYIDECL